MRIATQPGKGFCQKHNKQVSMVAIKKYTAADMTAAKAAGFKTKKPKKPKAKTDKSLDGYAVRYNVWVDKLKTKAVAGRVKLAKAKTLADKKAKIAAL